MHHSNAKIKSEGWSKLGEVFAENANNSSSAAVAPEAIFIRVDFPAPFSPRRARTSPAYSSKETPLSAIVPGKLFTIALTDNKALPVFTFSPDLIIEIQSGGYF